MLYDDNTQPKGEDTCLDVDCLDVDNTTRDINEGAKPQKVCSETVTDKPTSVTNNNKSERIPVEDLDAIVDIFKTLMKWDEELNGLSLAA